jgi:hypothetical protein
MARWQAPGRVGGSDIALKSDAAPRFIVPSHPPLPFIPLSALSPPLFPRTPYPTFLSTAISDLNWSAVIDAGGSTGWRARFNSATILSYNDLSIQPCAEGGDGREIGNP